MIIKYCQNCNKECHVPPTKEERFRYCSRECRAAGEQANVVVACSQCGKEVVKHKSRAERTRYCSRECLAIGRGYTQATPINCSICGKSFLGSKQRRTCSDECADRGRAGISRPSGIIIRQCDACGSKYHTRKCRQAKYCSKYCRTKDVARRATGKTRTSQVLPCDYCGQPVKKYRCRIANTGRVFCNNDCYHAWDSEYKQTPEMLERLAQSLANSLGKSSKIEQIVAQWLDSHGILYRPQVSIGPYIFDFEAGDVLVEVHGCYWHGCLEHRPPINKIQHRRVARDKSMQTYCSMREIPLLIIWEHDIRAGNFEALSSLLPANSRA